MKNNKIWFPDHLPGSEGRSERPRTRGRGKVGRFSDRRETGRLSEANRGGFPVIVPDWHFDGTRRVRV